MRLVVPLATLALAGCVTPLKPIDTGDVTVDDCRGRGCDDTDVDGGVDTSLGDTGLDDVDTDGGGDTDGLPDTGDTADTADTSQPWIDTGSTGSTGSTGGTGWVWPPDTGSTGDTGDTSAWQDTTDTWWTIDTSFDSASDTASQNDTRADTGQPPWASTCLDFDSVNWTYVGNAANVGHPVASGSGEIVLTEDNVPDASAAVIATTPLTLPYRIAFDYLTDDDDGGRSLWYNSADGVVLMFQKDLSTYADPPTGGTTGFLDDGTGMGVRLATYDVRRMEILDGNNMAVATAYANRVYTGGQWRHVVVEVTASGVTAHFDHGVRNLAWRGAVPTQFDGWGLAAATGGSDSEHRIRHVCVGPITP